MREVKPDSFMVDISVKIHYHFLFKLFLPKFLLVQGHDVIVSLVAPYKELRESFKYDLQNLLVEFYVTLRL